MKILFKNRSFDGGAPRSMLEYIKLAKKNGIHAVAAGQFEHDPTFYIENDINVINIPYFHLKRPIYNFFQLLKYIKLINKERPDMIHTITSENCLFHSIIEKTMNIPVIKTIPGGKIGRFIAEFLKKDPILVFSDENKLDLIRYGHDSKKITVISNRMNFENVSGDHELFYQSLINNRGKQIRILAISRVSKSKIKSLLHTIGLVDQLTEDNINVRLDILGDGDCISELQEKADEINLKFNNEIVILHGFQKDVKPYIQNSHFLFGKGRSIIDGIINHRISFVVNEEYNMCLCTDDTFENLKTYNFTGRNLYNSTSYEELIEIIETLYNGSFNLIELDKINQLTKESYDIKLADNKIMQLYNNVGTKKINFDPSIFKIIKEYLLFYLNVVKVKFRI